MALVPTIPPITLPKQITSPFASPKMYPIPQRLPHQINCSLQRTLFSLSNIDQKENEAGFLELRL